MSKSKTQSWKRKPHYYWWLLANALAACAAIISWTLSLHVFGHPEIPKNYHLIKRLNLAEPAPAFKLQEAPDGQSADARDLYRRYAELDPNTIQQLNQSLLRNYLTGLKNPELIQYIEGQFEITHVRALKTTDILHPGTVVRARSMIKPTEFDKPTPWPVTIDYLFPTPNPEVTNWFRHGDQLEVAKAPNCALLLNVNQTTFDNAPMLQLTVVPIALGEYRLSSNRSFHVVAPTKINPSARFPLFKNDPFTVPSIENKLTADPE